MNVRAGDVGYTAAEFALVTAGTKNHDLMPVGSVIKRGDEYYIGPKWVVVDDKFIGMKIDVRFRPVRRRKRWSCWHMREDSDKFCPVCMPFQRYVTDKW